MSVGNNARLRQLLDLHASGQLERARVGCRTQGEWAERLGMTNSAFRSAMDRARAFGYVLPRWSDTQIGDNRTQVGYGDSRPQVASPTEIWPATDDEFDFSDEEKTTPDARFAVPPQVGHSPIVRAGGTREPFTRHLTREEVSDGSIIAVLSDVHIPHHDERAMQIVIECCEASGVTHVFLNGDIADCGPSSRHEGKRRREILMWGDLPRSIEPGMWIYEWARTKRCILLFGNHEGWVEHEVKESPTMHQATPESLMGLPADGDGWEVLPMLSRIRLGSRVWEHGDGFFKTGSPGQNPGARLKSKAPDQTTSIGHCHIKHATYWTSEDEHGIARTRAAFFNGHLSRPEAHGEYAGTYLNWQQSFEITRVWYDGDRPRFTTDQPEIHRDRYGNPIFEYQGRIYR